MDEPILKEGLSENKTYRTCSICQQTVRNQVLSRHLMQNHEMNQEQYVLHVLGLTEIPKCKNPSCENLCNFVSISRGFTDTCCKSCAASKPENLADQSIRFRQAWENRTEEQKIAHSERSSALMAQMNRGEIHPKFKQNRDWALWVNDREYMTAVLKRNGAINSRTLGSAFARTISRFQGDKPVLLYMFSVADYLKIGVTRNTIERLNKFSILGKTRLIKSVYLDKISACLHEQRMLEMTRDYEIEIEIKLGGSSELRSSEAKHLLLGYFNNFTTTLL